jgi:sulfur carrier protein ThiS
MVKLHIVLQPPLDALASLSGDSELVEADTVYGALADVSSRHPRMREQLFSEDGLSPFIHIFLNGNLVPAERCRQQVVADHDELCLLTAIRGG